MKQMVPLQRKQHSQTLCVSAQAVTVQDRNYDGIVKEMRECACEQEKSIFIITYLFAKTCGNLTWRLVVWECVSRKMKRKLRIDLCCEKWSSWDLKAKRILRIHLFSGKWSSWGFAPRSHTEHESVYMGQGGLRNVIQKCPNSCPNSLNTSTNLDGIMTKRRCCRKADWNAAMLSRQHSNEKGFHSSCQTDRKPWIKIRHPQEILIWVRNPNIGLTKQVCCEWRHAGLTVPEDLFDQSQREKMCICGVSKARGCDGLWQFPVSVMIVGLRSYLELHWAIQDSRHLHMDLKSKGSVNLVRIFPAPYARKYV